MGLSVTQQLAKLMLEMGEVLPNLEKAFHTVKDLRLRFEHRPYVKGRTKDTHKRLPEPLLPSSFGIVTRAVCARFAAAVPNVQELRLEGNCVDAAFSVFGASCPGLIHLDVETNTVPLTALSNVSGCLTHLICFTFTPPRVSPHANQVTNYVAAVMRALQPCALLRTLELDLSTRRFQMECLPSQWDAMPANLASMTFKCARGSIVDAPLALTNSVSRLALSSCSGAELFALLQKAAQLQHICVPCTSVMVLLCDSEAVPQGISLLKQRLLGGFTLDVTMVRLVGSSEGVADVLRILPTLAGVQSCTLEVLDAPDPLLLASISRVFPNLVQFELLNPHGMVEVPEDVDVGLQLVEPLWACPYLRDAIFRDLLPFTTAGLAVFCNNVGHLRHLNWVECPGVTLAELRILLDDVE